MLFCFVLCSFIRIFAPNQPQEPQRRRQLGLLWVKNNTASAIISRIAKSVGNCLEIKDRKK